MPKLTIRDENGEISQNITKEQRKEILDFIGPLAVALPEDKTKEALRWALEWIDAVPKDMPLPTMPGFDRDYVNALLETDGES